MLRVLLATTVILMSFVSAATVLQVRQLGPPDIPGDTTQCQSQCAPVIASFGCDDTDLTCYCTDSNVQGIADCYSCLTPFVQPQVPTWTSDAQDDLNNIIDVCAANGHSVSSPKFDGATVPTTSIDSHGGDSSPTDSDDSSPTDSDDSSPTDSDGSSPTDTATDGFPAESSTSQPTITTGGSSPASKVPAGATQTPTSPAQGGSNGAISSSPISTMALAGVFGGAIVLLGF